MYYGVGFTHSDVYEMPIYLRNYYYKKLVSAKEKENAEIKKSQQKSRARTPNVNNPRFK